MVSALILPPTVLALAGAGGLLLHRWQPRLGRALIAASLLALLLLSSPWLANALQRNLEIYGPIRPDAVGQAQAIVVLGGGTYHDAPEFGGLDTSNRYGLARARYAAYLHRLSGLPILAAGGAPRGGRTEAEAMGEVLERDFQVKVRWLETRSRDTAENAQYSREVLAKGSVSTVVLVTDAIHMARAKLAFEKAGFVVLPAPTNFATDSSGFDFYLPSSGALDLSARAIKEWLGLKLARLR